MPVEYTKYLRPRLADRMKQIIGSTSHAEQLRLYEEIALGRTMLTENLIVAEALAAEQERFARGEQGAQPVQIDTVIFAMGQVRACVEHVAELVSKQSRIEKDLGDKVAVTQLGAFVEQLTQITFRVLGEEHRDLAMRLSEAVQEQLVLEGDFRADPGIPLDTEIRVEYE